MTAIAIKPVMRSDAGALIQANIDSRDHHAPWTEPFTDMAGFESWFDQSITGSNVSLVAREQATGGIIGVFNLSQIILGPFCSAYLGYYGMAAHAGRGLMTQALGLCTADAFGAIGLHRLKANVQPGNTPSIALVRRTGFRKEGFSPRYLKIGGVWCDHERWALLADDPNVPVHE